MSYIDGFLLPVPTDKLYEYKKIAENAGKIWMEHGALAYVESIGDDMTPQSSSEPDFEFAKFPQAANANENETVVFSYIVYKSREDRDRVNAAVMADPRIKDCHDVPFDSKRMYYGGFKSLVEMKS